MPLFRRFAAVLVVLLAPVVPNQPGGGGDQVHAQPRQAAASVPIGRIAYAGTDHRSLGAVTDPDPVRLRGTEPLFGAGPQHYDRDPDSRDGLTVFTSLRDERTPQVYVRDRDGGVRQLTTGRDAAHPELTPDGTQVVFDSIEPTPNGNGTQCDLWVVGVDGTGLRRLTDTATNEREPSVSAEGTRVAFTSPDLDPARGEEIYLMPLAGGQVVRVTDEPNGAAIEPKWNPVNDNTHLEKLAYTLDADGNLGDNSDQSVRVIECNTGATTGTPVLGGDRANWQSREPTWKPDGATLLIVSRNIVGGGTPEPQGTADRIYQLDAGGVLPCPTAPEPLLVENRNGDSPTWLAGAGQPRLILARSTAAAPNIADLQDIRSNGVDPRDLGLSVLREDPGANADNRKLFHPTAGYDPWTIRQAYSPDGRRIAVSRFETINGRRVERIWISDADGGNAAPVPIADRKPGDWETDVSWSPDGTKLAIARRSPGAFGPDRGPSRIVVVNAGTGTVLTRLSNPDPSTADQDDTQPAFSPDGSMLAFSRGTTASDNLLREQHIFLARAGSLDQQRDITRQVCPCGVIDDSPVFSVDGHSLIFNRENDGLLRYSLDDNTCRVVLPRTTPETSCIGPINAPQGPYQPRDVSYGPNDNAVALSSRRASDPNSAEALSTLDPDTGTLTPLTTGLAGRQKEPSWQVKVNLSITAPPTAGPVASGSDVGVTARVTNNGPAPAPASTVSIAPGGGLSVGRLSTGRGTCDVRALRCDLGTLAPGASVPVTAQFAGGAPGDSTVDFSTTSSVLDADPGDNSASTGIRVLPAPGDRPPPPRPTPRPAPPPPPPQKADPSVRVTAAPNPGYVGGRVALLYRVSNRSKSRATGLRVSFNLPRGIPVAALPAGCSMAGCFVGDLRKGQSTTLQVVLAPKRKGTAMIRARVRTNGQNANRRNDTSLLRLQIRQPRIVAVPPIGKPGFVTSVRGFDFPPGAPVRLRWNPGITAAEAPSRPNRAGRFAGQLLILTKDQTGPRIITASGPGFSPVTTRFLVVPGLFSPPDLVSRR